MKALPAYLALFCLENAIRELVAERLSENHGSDWWETCAPAGVRNKAAERKEREGKSRWHAQRGAHPINYTDFGDLKSLIANNWASFEDLLPDLNWVNSRLDELEASRNIIAHSNVLEQREIDRMRLYLERLDSTGRIGVPHLVSNLCQTNTPGSDDVPTDCIAADFEVIRLIRGPGGSAVIFLNSES